MITSKSNPRVVAAARLREARGRREQGRIVVDGARELDRAAAAGVAVVEVYFCPALAGPSTAALAERLGAHGAEVLEVSTEVLAKIGFGDRAEGIVGIARTPERRLEAIELAPNALVAVLERVEKPGNVGAVLRSADAAGVAAVVVADPATDLFNPNAIRASMGAIFTVPVCTATAAEALNWLQARGMPIYAARVDAELSYDRADLRRGAALVLGSEAEGLSAAWAGAEVTPIGLPMLGIVDSLNVSATAAVLFYEAWRQRRTAE